MATVNIAVTPERTPPSPPTNTLTRAEWQQLLAGMTSSLRGIYDQLQQLLSSSAAEEIHGRYQMAKILTEVKRNEASLGPDPLGRLGAALGMRRSSVFQFLTVAKRWEDEGELNALVDLGKNGGWPLTWSHIVELARIEDSVARARLVDEAIGERLAVRGLRQRVALIATRRVAQPAAKSRPRTAMAGSLCRIDGHLSKSLEAEADRLAKEATEIAAAGLKGREAEAATSALQDAREKCQRIRVACAKALSAIEHATGAMRRQLSTTTAAEVRPVQQEPIQRVEPAVPAVMEAEKPLSRMARMIQAAAAPLGSTR